MLLQGQRTNSSRRQSKLPSVLMLKCRCDTIRANLLRAPNGRDNDCMLVLPKSGAGPSGRAPAAVQNLAEVRPSLELVSLSTLATGPLDSKASVVPDGTLLKSWDRCTHP